MVDTLHNKVVTLVSREGSMELHLHRPGIRVLRGVVHQVAYVCFEHFAKLWSSEDAMKSVLGGRPDMKSHVF